MRTMPSSPWYVLGTGTQYDTQQDHLKAKLAYDITPTVSATYILGTWQNKSDGNSASYLRDAAGNVVYSGPININGLAYTGSQALTGGDFAVTRESADPFHAGPGGQEPHAGRMGLGSRSQPVRLSQGRQAPERGQQSAAGRGQRRRRHPRRRQRHAAGPISRSRAPGDRPKRRASTSSTSACSTTTTSCRYPTFAHRRQLAAGRRRERWPARSAARPRLHSVYAQDAWASRRRGRPCWACAPSSGARTTGRPRSRPPAGADVSRAARELPVAEGRAVVPGAHGCRAQGIGRPGGAHADGQRAVRRHFHDQLAVHQRPEPQAREVLDHRADGREGVRGRLGCA